MNANGFVRKETRNDGFAKDQEADSDEAQRGSMDERLARILALKRELPTLSNEPSPRQRYETEGA